MDGVLVIDKPAGPTSHDVVAVARRALRERRIGHTGTLDPLATGVLPLVIGRATRLASLLSSGEKEYFADVRLGGATATYDAADRFAIGGPPPPPPEIRRERVEEALARFRGSFEQVPPAFSAKKVSGVPSYRLARRDEAAELKAVAVTVHALEIIDFSAGLVRLRMVTSPGFYVRSLAHDLGAALGCGAHLEALRRTRAGVFGLNEAIQLTDLQERSEAAAARLISLERLLPELPAALLTESGARKASHGNPLGAEDFTEFTAPPVSMPVRLIGPAGDLLGIAKGGPDGILRPYVVLV